MFFVVVFSLEKRRFWEDPIVAFQCLKKVYRKAGKRLFIREDSDVAQRSC